MVLQLSAAVSGSYNQREALAGAPQKLRRFRLRELQQPEIPAWQLHDSTGIIASLNQRAGTPVKPEDYEGIRLYWAPKDIHKTRERLKSLGFGVSELEPRDYGQTEFVLTDDDGYSHCFGVPTQR